MNVNGRSKIGKKQEVEVEKKERSMKTITIISLLCLGMFFVIGTGVAFATGENTHTETDHVSLTIPHTANLVLTNPSSSKTLVQDGSAEEAFEAGLVDLTANYPTLTVRANKHWVLSAQGSWDAACPYLKAIADLKLKNTGTYASNGFKNAFKSLSGTNQEIASNAIGVRDDINACQYEVMLDYTRDIPGVYTATVTYTLATQAS